MSCEQDKSYILPDDLTIGNFDLVGSCNGLICILLRKKCFLLRNPATKEVRWLPDFQENGYHIRKFGFGFDESSDDYKVFVVLCKFEIETLKSATIGKIYSLKGDTWKRMEEIVKDEFTTEERGKFASGKLHWIKRAGLNTRRRDIITFDLQSEAFGIFRQPIYVGESRSYATLQVFNECLCVQCNYGRTELDIWIWHNSWTRLVTVSARSFPQARGHFFQCSPLCILPDGGVLFTFKNSFVSYHPNKSWVQYAPPTVGSVIGVAEVFVESLVSLENI